MKSNSLNKSGLSSGPYTQKFKDKNSTLSTPSAFLHWSSSEDGRYGLILRSDGGLKFRFQEGCVISIEKSQERILHEGGRGDWRGRDKVGVG